jgi:hypothetical protein
MRLNLRGEFKATIDRSNRKPTATLNDLTAEDAESTEEEKREMNKFVIK